MFKAKYKAHRLVNIIFYIIVFLVGFYMGLIGKNIGIKEIFNKFMFIDNVSAIESHIYNYDGDYTHPAFPVNSNNMHRNNLYINEQYIFKLFNHFMFNLELPYTMSDFPYVATMGSSNVSSTHVVWYFTSSPLQGNVDNFYTGNLIRISYSSSNNPPYKWTIQTSDNLHVNNSYGNVFSNQENFGNSSLDFTEYIMYNFNINLFSNSSDFKEVCINPKNPFTISTESLDVDNSNIRDYLWFPGSIVGFQNSTINLQNSTISSFEEYLDNKYTFLNSPRDIDVFFENMNSLSNPDISIPLKTDYNTLFPPISYYGWSAYSFNLSYNPGSYVLPVYKLRNDYITFQLSNSHVSHGGGSRTHHDLENEQNPSNVCFWINKDFDIAELTEDEYGFYTSTISTPYGDYLYYGSSKNSNSFFDNFKGNTYGLTSFLTAPINALRSISNGVCTPQSISILGKTITLPCGDTLFWGREDIQEFKIFWNIFAGGLLAYCSGIYLFKSIQKIKDPDNAKIEVIDL